MNTAKALIVTFALLLAGCGGATPKIACTNDSVNHLVWGQIIYTLPSCWVSNEPGDNTLILTSEETQNAVIFQKTAPATLTQGTQTFPLSTGETLYAIPTSPDDWDTKIVLNSIKITSFNVAPTSCEVPETDYPQSVNYTWQGITFGLPYCWGAEESHSIRGNPQLMIYKTQANGQYLRVNFWSTDPLDNNYVKIEDVKISEIPAEKYSDQAEKNNTDTSTIFVLGTAPAWYIETNAPDDYSIQELLSTLSIVPVTFPTQE
jgi:hypothetical protein